jgi:hypothetical protein
VNTAPEPEEGEPTDKTPPPAESTPHADNSLDDVPPTSNASTHGDDPGDNIDALVPIPTTDAEWGQLISLIPDKLLREGLRKDKRLFERIFAGFRPNTPVDKIPNGVQKLAIEAKRNPAVAKSIRELAATDAKAKAEANNTTAGPAKPPSRPAPAPVVAKPTQAAKKPPSANEVRLKDRLKESDRTLKEVRRVAEAAAEDIKRLRDQIAKQKDEIAILNGQHRVAQRKINSLERNIKDWKGRYETAKAEARTRRQSSAPSPIAIPTPQPTSPDPWLETAADLVQMGRTQVAITFLGRLVENPELQPLVKATAHLLMARAHRDLRDPAQSIQCANLAAEIFLDKGAVVEALDCLFDAIAHAGPDDNLELSSWTFTRILKFAHRDNCNALVVERLRTLRIFNKPVAEQVSHWDGLRNGRFKHLWTESAPVPPSKKLAPDEIFALPSSNPDVAAISARKLVQAIASGNTDVVDAVRNALQRLPPHKQGLSSALIAGIEELEPNFSVPLIREGLGPALVDASNVARCGPDRTLPQANGKMRRLARMRQALLREGYFPVIGIADENLRYIIDDKAEFERWLQDGALRGCGTGTIADEILIAEARRTNALVVTNDQFRDHLDTEDIRVCEFGIDHDDQPFLLLQSVIKRPS